ncbi:One cut domain family member [Dirofilaria immitis]|nr:One cut domain family member [Dirofilaria immitis]
MEGLESSGPMTSNSSDPLLSATLPSSSPPQPDSYRNHIHDDSYSGHSRSSPHNQTAGTATAFNQYTTLTPLQPLPPISTVTNSSVKFNRSTASPAVSESASGTPSSGSLFFQQTPTSSMPSSLNFGSFAYNVNIKYVYDMKNEPDTEDGQPTDSNNDNRNEYTTPVTLHQQLHQLAEPFSPSQSPYVPSYSGVLEPKQEKLDFISSTSYNTFNGPSDILDAETMETVKRNGSSPLQTDTISHAGSPDSGSDMDELNTKILHKGFPLNLNDIQFPKQSLHNVSQGTLSDLLRNPKPWSKLKSGRETFRRMAKWLQEPEFQRMSALRLAVSKHDILLMIMMMMMMMMLMMLLMLMMLMMLILMLNGCDIAILNDDENLRICYS